ncbi:hypothetical protein AKJ41_02005 [candidate division MSBL1 archaeon SCGC-AAA259O05]|uniref:Uncharacterized protein n=1 Tax=candidate division MSBL1 archaeon SCGC-AAA259O05 TaxID=1698271 RepID=A0A133V4D4_9EURY|nr:hypothetical protein AKJ41_02005 [candidate division MSBL1 archaeon SCGC-AAA259O05]
MKDKNRRTKDFKDFLKITCQISATMASITFVGLGIILSVYPSPFAEGTLGNAGALAGITSVLGFSYVAFHSLLILDPYERGSRFEVKDEENMKSKEKLLKLTLSGSWLLFIFLLISLWFKL